MVTKDSMDNIEGRVELDDAGYKVLGTHRTDEDTFYNNINKIVEQSYDSNVNSEKGKSNNNAEDLQNLLKRERDFSYGPISKMKSQSVQTADKSASLWDFIKMVNKLVDVTLKDLNAKFIPDEGKDNLLEPIQKIDSPYISYKVLSRKSKEELKPRHRQEILEGSGNDERFGEIFGQKFTCYVQFNFFAHGYNEVETLMDRFEEMINMYTGYLKKNGVAEVLFHEQRTDDNYNVLRQQISIRNLIYRVEIEKLTVIFRERIKDIELILNQKEA